VPGDFHSPAALAKSEKSPTAAADFLKTAPS
jgi:hypothetical protein